MVNQMKNRFSDPNPKTKKIIIAVVVAAIILIGLYFLYRSRSSHATGSSSFMLVNASNSNLKLSGNSLYAYGEDESNTAVSSLDGVAWPASSILTLYSATGSGVVTRLQFACQSYANADAIITFAIDGYTCSADLGCFFGQHLGGSNSTLGSGGSSTPATAITNGYSNDNVTFQGANYNGSQNGMSRKVYIPFNRSILITVNTNPSVDMVSSQVTSRVHSRPYTSFPLYQEMGVRRRKWRCLVPLNSEGSKEFVITPQTVAGTNIQTFFSLQGPGELESLQMVIWNENNLSYLEGNPVLTIDSTNGSTGTNINFGSTDNFFGGQFYFNQGGSLFSSDRSGLFAWNASAYGTCNMHAYKFFGPEDPVKFNSNLSFTWVNGQASKSSGLGPASVIVMVTYWTEN